MASFSDVALAGPVEDVDVLKDRVESALNEGSSGKMFVCDWRSEYLKDTIVCDYYGDSSAEYSAAGVDVEIRPFRADFFVDAGVAKDARVAGSMYFSVSLDSFNRAKIDCRPADDSPEEAVCEIEAPLDSKFSAQNFCEGYGSLPSALNLFESEYEYPRAEVLSCSVEQNGVDDYVARVRVRVSASDSEAVSALRYVMGYYYAEDGGIAALEEDVARDLSNSIEDDMKSAGYDVSVSVAVPVVGGGVEYYHAEEYLDVFVDYMLPVEIYIDAHSTAEAVRAVRYFFEGE